MNKIFKIIILTITLCIYIAKAWGVSETYINEKVTKTEILKYAPEQTEPEPELDPEPAVLDYTVPEQLIENQFIVDMQNEINKDIVAWIRIDGTNIDYPILSALDNETYLYTDINNNPSNAGSLFTDYRCTQNFRGFNTIIYGHNMKNRSMFGDLRNYADINYLSENRYGTLWTSANTYKFEIFAFMVITSDNSVIYANPKSETAFIEYIKENASIYIETDTEKVITLSTCGYEFAGARIVVIASVLNITAVG